MTDDIVTRLRNRASRCTHGNERYYNGPEGIEKYFNAVCGWCFSCFEAADEIERLREEVYDLNEVMKLQYRELEQLAEHRFPSDSTDNPVSEQTS